MSGSRARALLALAASVALTVAPRLPAQEADARLRVHPELRADFVLAQGRSSLQTGAGIQIPAGVYARIGVIGAVGTSISDGGIDGRMDLLARFLFDPYRQNRWGVSAGGGITAGVMPGDRLRPRLLVAIDVEGQRSASSISPAFQLGLGGGVRIGGALRWGSSRTR